MRATTAGLWLTSLAAAVLLAATGGCENDNDLRGDEMYISPSHHAFNKPGDRVISFGVHGAALPVEWSVSDPDLGTITGVRTNKDAYANVTAANYERIPGKYGNNTIIVRDSRNWQASATVSVREGLDGGSSSTNSP